ncbi:MAG: hypothetical protein JO021_06680 [Alphaproteobacteria bacterium]|nr:hypothetical protein [Alphaproteobacteria bacterium]
MVALVGLTACEEMMQPRFKTEPGMMQDAQMWCTNSPEPSRCRGRSGVEHEVCKGVPMEKYASCRFALDQMHGY